MAIVKLKRHKSPGIDKIPAELIKARGRKISRWFYKMEASADRGAHTGKKTQEK